MSFRIFAGSLLLLLACCSRKEPERFSSIDGHPQHILDLGSGEPAVIFLAGRASNLETFDSVQQAIAKITRTFSYDRAGIRKSEMTDTVRTFETMIKELDQLLINEEVKPPYILVGHSMGGFLARYYYHVHKENVAGIIMIDPGHEDDMKVFLDARTGIERTRIDSLFHTIDPNWPLGPRLEVEYSERNDNLMRMITPPSGIPVTLFISTKLEKDEIGTTQSDIDARTKLMTDWISTIPGAKTILTSKSGHFIQEEEPQLVGNEIKRMIEEVNK